MPIFSRFNIRIFEPILSRIRNRTPINANQTNIDSKNWYKKFISFDEVQYYRERFANLQENLLTVQKLRDEIVRKLTEVRKNSNQFHEELLDLLIEERKVSRQFGELFIAFADTTRDSYVKQCAQLEKIKKFGIILSIVLAFCCVKLSKNDVPKSPDRLFDVQLQETGDWLSSWILCYLFFNILLILLIFKLK